MKDESSALLAGSSFILPPSSFSFNRSHNSSVKCGANGFSSCSSTRSAESGRADAGAISADCRGGAAGVDFGDSSAASAGFLVVDAALHERREQPRAVLLFRHHEPPDAREKTIHALNAAH